MDLKGKLALVTGSTSGIGLSIAHTLAKTGCDIIITGLGDDDVIKGIVQSIKSEHKVNAEFIGADLTKVDRTKALVSELLQKHPGGVDILINNAGMESLESIEELSDETWDTMVALHLTAPFQLIKLLLPTMKKKGWGRIVNTSSTMGLVSGRYQSVYSATKHGLIGLTKGVALEVAAHGITCNAICPGAVATALLKGAITQLAKTNNVTYEEQEAHFLMGCATGSFATPEQVADLVLFLVASSASSQMTGAAYLIDGGYTAQ